MFGNPPPVSIKATFLTDYVHTVIILVIILIFALTAYATGSELGSPSVVYDRLVAAAAAHPVEGNAGGSYLTMQSKEGAIFFVINIAGNLGTVFMDNGEQPLRDPGAAGLTKQPLHRILQQGHCRVARPRSPRLHHRRAGLVRHPVVVRHDHGTVCPGPGGHPSLPYLSRTDAACRCHCWPGASLCLYWAARPFGRCLHPHHDLQ